MSLIPVSVFCVVVVVVVDLALTSLASHGKSQRSDEGVKGIIDKSAYSVTRAVWLLQDAALELGCLLENY